MAGNDCPGCGYYACTDEDCGAEDFAWEDEGATWAGEEWAGQYDGDPSPYAGTYSEE